MFSFYNFLYVKTSSSLQADRFINEQRANQRQNDTAKKYEHSQLEAIPAHKPERPERKYKIKNLAYNVARNGIDYGFHSHKSAGNFARLKFSEKRSGQSDEPSEKRGLNRKVDICNEARDGD